MKINLDRLCRLAGVEASPSEVLSEASNRSYHEDPALDAEREVQFSNQLNETDDMNEMGSMMPMEDEHDKEKDEGMMHGEMPEMYTEDLDEVIEVDEAMLVQEIRRARKMLAESRKQPESSGSLTEAQLKEIVAEEVSNVMKDLNLTAGWVYGDKKPTNVHRGAVNTAFPGIGFRNDK
jgi:hypothetical protein